MTDQLYDSLPSNGWLTREEAELLWEVANEADGDILEVGSYHGRSTCLLGNTGRRVYAVDPFEGFSTEDPSGHETCRTLIANLLQRNLQNVEVFSRTLAEWPRRSVNFAYLDGDHTAKGTEEQISVALACGARIIAIHDVNDSGDGRIVRDVALKFLGPWRRRVGRLAVWIVR